MLLRGSIVNFSVAVAADPFFHSPRGWARGNFLENFLEHFFPENFLESFCVFVAGLGPRDSREPRGSAGRGISNKA